MAKYSLEDILAEEDTRRSRRSGDKVSDDFLADILGDKKPLKNNDITFSEADKKAEEKRKKEEERKSEELRLRKLEEERLAAKKAAEEKKQKALEEQRLAAEKRRQLQEEAKRKKAEQEAERKRLAEMAAKRVAEQEAERKRLIEERERKKAEEDAKIAALSEEEQKKALREAEERRKAEEESERKYATKNIVFEEVPLELPKAENPEEAPKQPTPEEIELEKALRQQKLEDNSQKLLEKESVLEDPDDFISAMNPYEFGTEKDNGVGLTQLIETVPAEQLIGDTVVIAGEDLRELVRNTAHKDERSFEEIIDGATTVMPDIGVKPYETGFDMERTFVVGDEIKRYTAKSGDNYSPGSTTREVTKAKTPEEEKLLISINKTIEQKRLSDISVRNSLPSDTGAYEPVIAPVTKSLQIKAIGATLPRTGQIPINDPLIAEQKVKELASKRKRRISNFVLEDINDDDYSYDDETEPESFAAEDDDAQIWTDLTYTHKSLRLRFILLLIITLFLGAVTLIGEFGGMISFELFGAEINFLDKRLDMDGFVYMNMILGVVGMGLCRSVIQNGLIKLFKGSSDCDTVCSVACVLSLLGAFLHLTNTDYLQRSRAFIYISVALAGLMFNTLGKLSMIVRAKKNFRFISSDLNKYYADVVDGQSEATALTKGVISELPYLVTMRKTELLTEFLRKSYCEDKADRLSRRLVPISLLIAVVMGVLAYFVPNGIEGMENNIYWASSVLVGLVSVMAPFSTMFLVNNPMRRASKALAKSGCALLGYTAAEEFGETNSVLVDVNTLFPKANIECTNLKPCKFQNSFNNISLDQAIILAASLAIKSGSILSGLFYDMIGGNKELLADIDGCVYEDNMGVMGWYGNKRLIMGNREHMKHHSIKVPEMSAIAKYCRNGSDSVYLSVGGELTIIFFIRLTPNPRIRACVKELIAKGVSISVKTTDSIITVGKIADTFDVDPEKIKVLSGNLHDVFEECTKFTPRGSGAMTCNGSFVSLARGILASKKILKDVSLSQMFMTAGIFIGTLVLILLALSVKCLAFSPAIILGYNLLWLLIMLLVQAFRRY